MSAVAAKPGESLIGLLGRTARRNHLPGLQPLLGTCTSTGHARFNLASREDIDFYQLAYAARLAPHEVESRRYRSIMLTADLPGWKFHGATIPIYDLDLRLRRLATTWLVGDAFHCALGHHTLATHCPRSGFLLFDRCQRCKARLNWSRLDLSHCVACGFDLSRGEPQRVTERELNATRLMLDVIHPDPARNEDAQNRLPALLGGLDRGTIFELGWRFGDLLSGGGHGSRNSARRLSVETRLQILELGSEVLASWPECIRSAMQGVAPGRSEVDPTLPKAVRAIAKATNSWPEVRTAIYAAVPGLAVSARVAVRSVLPKPANGAEFARSLGVDQRVFERMRDADLFAPVSASGVVKHHGIYDITQAEELRDLLADRIPLTSASERLGISVHGVEQLCCVSELRHLCEDAVVAASKSRQISAWSLESLRRRLEAAATEAERSPEIESDLIPMYWALRGVGAREKPWGPIVVAMLAGSLPFMLDKDRVGPLMDRVSLPADSVHLLYSMRFDPNTHSGFEFDPLINGRDAEEMLNVTCSTFSRAAKNGELPTRSGGRYNRVEMLNLAKATMSLSEVRMRWARGKRCLPEPMRGRGAPARIGQLGWRRMEAMRAMAGSNPSFPDPDYEPPIVYPCS